MADNSFVLPGLVKKRTELAGDIERPQADLQRMFGELEHLDAQSGCSMPITQ
jgi:hypothetical protein